MIDRSQIGARAEARARRYLRRRGLKHLASNFRCRGGELDLVMEDGGTTVFVEVRRRSRGDYGSASESITETKKHRLIRAAEQFLVANRRDHKPARFDVVAIDGSRRPARLTWLRDAFQVE